MFGTRPSSRRPSSRATSRPRGRPPCAPAGRAAPPAPGRSRAAPPRPAPRARRRPSSSRIGPTTETGITGAPVCDSAARSTLVVVRERLVADDGADRVLPGADRLCIVPPTPKNRRFRRGGGGGPRPPPQGAWQGRGWVTAQCLGRHREGNCRWIISVLTATLMDGRAPAARIRDEVAREVAVVRASDRARDRARRGRSGLRRLHPGQAHGDARGRDRGARPAPAGDDDRGGVARARRGAERERRGRRHPRPAAAAGPDRRGARDPRRRPAQGRGRLPSAQRRPPARRHAGARAGNAARRARAARRVRRRAEGRERGRDRPQRHRRQARRAAPPPPARDRDDLPLAHPRPRRRDSRVPT